ncbi:MAG: glutaredoxin family protein [Kangiellaceae bacterium]|nr:glutaredoxin family protein [Kangiellaceae bacterium]
MTTAGCHLCEQAWEMIQYIRLNLGDISKNLRFEQVEISENDELVEMYGIRIPVLVNETDQLGWPFEFEELVDWLAKTD